MSKNARNQRDKRAEAFALHRSDTSFPMTNGDTLDPRAPWQLPGQGKEPEPPIDPWGDWEPSHTPVPIGPTDCTSRNSESRA